MAAIESTTLDVTNRLAFRRSHGTDGHPHAA